jgi:hypothetical protein
MATARANAKSYPIYSALLAVGGDTKCIVPLERTAPELALLEKLHTHDGGLTSPLSEVKRSERTDDRSVFEIYDDLVARYGLEPVRRIIGNRGVNLPTEYTASAEAADTAEA